jgi:hypothetical protein
MSTRDLINAIAAGDAIEIENTFASTMAEKISARLDDIRVDIAQSMFRAPESVVEEETNLDELTDLQKKVMAARASSVQSNRRKRINQSGTHNEKLDQKKDDEARAKKYSEDLEVSEAELDEMINEVLTKDAGAGEWIHDFIHSDDPKFAGKSKEKRKQMALAAYYSKQRGE